jgi:hypothetical protein
MTYLAAGSSRCEHLLQRPQHRQHGLRIQFAERFEQPLRIDGAQLIEGDNAGAGPGNGIAAAMGTRDRRWSMSQTFDMMAVLPVPGNSARERE